MRSFFKLGILFFVSISLFMVGEAVTYSKGNSSPVADHNIQYASSNSKAYKETYNNLLKAITSFQSTAYFPSSFISYKEIGPILNQVLTDHPEIFYYKQEGTRFYSNGKIELKYKYPVKTIKEMVKKQDAKVNEIIKKTIKPGYSDFDKVKAIHDYIVLHTAYDWENYKKGKVPEASYTAYGLLVSGVAVCDGYAKTMKLLLDKVDVETEYVTGKGKGVAHSWNLVKLNGEYYYIDATWDDPVPNQKGKISYKYFLTPASYLKKDHTWNEKRYPAAKSSRFAYFQELSSVQETEHYYYYSNSLDHHKLYRMAKDGSKKTKILDVSAPYFAVTNDRIYFSNYSNGGYLYQSSLDGKNLKQLNKVHTVDLYLEGTKLVYKTK